MSLDSASRHEARFYEKTTWETTVCRLCPHNCSIAPSRSGNCGVRTNRNGTLYVDSYGKVTTAAAVGGEELPLFHYRPSIAWLSLSGRGCTMRCPFCNTYRFSQIGGARSFGMTPEEAVQRARNEGCGGISFGINEPAPMHEFVYDVFDAALAADLETHVATSAMWSPDAMRELAPLLRSATIGLKGYNERVYTDQLGGCKETIAGNIELLLTLGVHIEISWLVIPGTSDKPAEAGELLEMLDGYDVHPPILLLPYHPDFMWKNPRATELVDLTAFRGAFEGYPGVVYEVHPDSTALNTCCVQCGRPLIRRGPAGLIVTTEPTGKARTHCPTCGTEVPYVV